MTLKKNSGLIINLNHEKLSNIIRGHLCIYFNKTLNADDIDTLTKHLIDSIDDFMNTDKDNLIL
jgi:hypothetical protein